MKKQYHLICIVASLLFWLVGCCAIQIKDVPASISQEPLENEEISNSEQAESPLEAEDSTSVTITESGDFSEAEQLGFTGANIGQGGPETASGSITAANLTGAFTGRARTAANRRSCCRQRTMRPAASMYWVTGSIFQTSGMGFLSGVCARMEVKQKSSWMVIAIRSL